MTERALQKKGFPAQNFVSKRSSSGGRAWEPEVGESEWPQDAKRSAGARSWGSNLGEPGLPPDAARLSALRRKAAVPESEAEETVQKSATPESETEETVQKSATPESESEETVQKSATPESETEETVQKSATPESESEETVQKSEAPENESEETVQKSATPESETEETVQKSTTPESESEGTHIQAKCSECQREDEEKQKNESVQTKLTVGAPGDKYEQEADSTAAKVMAMPDSAIQPSIQRQTEEGNEGSEAVQMQPLANSVTPLVQRASGEEEEGIQMKSGGQQTAEGSNGASSSIESRLAGSKGGGSPLPNDVRSFMEPRFGADFGSVRVHTGSEAVQMNKELGAQAFAHGSDIYYGAGKSPGKDELTAHELTHTVQQGGSSQPKPNQKSPSKSKDNKKKSTHGEVAPENPKVKNEGSKEDQKTPTDAGTKAAVKDAHQALAEVTEKGTAPKPTGADKTQAAKEGAAKAEASPDKSTTPKKGAKDEGDSESNEVAKVDAAEEKVASEQGEAETAVNQTNAEMQTPGSDGEQMANTEINFAAAPAKPMFATTEEGISVLQPEEVLGSAGNDLVLYQTDNPEKTLAAKAAGIAIHKIPEDKAANTRDRQRLQAEAAVSKFMASGGQRVAKIAALGTTIDPRIQTATAQAKAAVDAAIAQNQSTITNAIAQARTKATNRAQAAKSQIAGQHTAAVAAIRASTNTARQRLQTEYQASIAKLTQIETSMAGRIAAPFNKAAQDFRAAGAKVGQEALQIGQTFQNQYAKESPPEPSNVVTEFLESFDRETYVTNWRKAKMDAARDLAANYNSGLIQDANNKANQLAENQPPVLQGMQDLLATTRTSLQTKHTAALQELNQSEQQAIQTANTTRDGQLQSVDQNLQGTLASLQQMQATQLSQVKTTGQQQKLGIDRNAKQVTAALRQGVNQANQNLQGAFQQFCTQAQGIKTPNIQIINSVIGEAQTQLDTLTAATQTELENGIGNSAQGIIQQSQQTLGSLNALGQQAAASANNAAEEFATSMGQQIQSATRAFAQLKSGHTIAVNASADKMVGEFKQMTADVGQKLDGVINNLNQKLGESTGQLETGLRGSLANLRSEIPTKAQEAAGKVQPAWKSVLKVVIDIVVTVAVTVAIAALAASGVGLVAAIGLAALIGAAGALVKQGANDLIDGKMSSWQTYAKAAGIGAATGVLQLVGLRGADKLAGASFLAKSSTFTKGAAKLGVESLGDTTVNITQQLAAGEKFSLEMVGKSFGSSLLSNVGGHGLNSAFGGLGKKLGVSQIENKLIKAGGEFAVETVKDTAIDVTNSVVIEGKDFSAEMLRDSAGRSALSNVVKGGANKAYGDKLRSLGKNDTTPTKPITDTPETRPVTIDEPTHKPVTDSSETKPVPIDEPTHKPVTDSSETKPVSIDEPTHKPVADSSETKLVPIDESTYKPTEETSKTKPVDADESTNKTIKNEPNEDQQKIPDNNKTETETPNKRSTHHDQPEVEPGIVAKEKAADGHDIKVLKDGRVVRCSDCGEIRKRYTNELEQSPELKKRLDDIEKISDPQEKAKQAQQIEQELAQKVKSEEPEVKEPDQKRKAEEIEEPGESSAKKAKTEEEAINDRQVGSAEKRWDDPTLTEADFIADYKKRFPDTSLSDDTLKQRFQDGMRLNPETGRLATPVRPIEPTGTRQNLPTEGKEFEAWQAYLKGDRSKPPCFPAGTLVKTPEGDKAIETLIQGDLVFAYNFDGNSVVERPITAVHKNWTQFIVFIDTAQGKLFSTRSHPYWVESEGKWLRAVDIQEGMILRLINGELLTVHSVDTYAAEEDTYNFEVKQLHNYFVNSLGVLVHNGDGETSGFEKTDTFATDIYEVKDINTGEIIYVGKSVQGVDTRFDHHLNDPKSAVYNYINNPNSKGYIPPNDPLRQASNFPKNLIDTVLESNSVRSGEWTRYETAVWEQYYIDKHGGVGGDKLINRINTITPEKFVLYSQGHNPCM